MSSGSTSYLANIYDGDGLRAEKTPETGASVFYLYDALSGEPLVEEQYSGGSASIQFVNIFGPDGWRERFSGASSSGNGEIAYAFDPQGSVENRYNASDQSLTADHMPATDVLVWDGYGLCLNDQWGKTASEAYDYQYNPAYDPAGFEAQYGYAGEWDNGLARNWTGTKSFQYYRYEPYLLTQRYYDPSTGKFASRDPIGTNGGENLYGYAGDDPVNEVDPSGDNAAGEFALGWISVGLSEAQSVLDPVGNALRTDAGMISLVRSKGIGGAAAAIGRSVVHSYTDLFTSKSYFKKGASARTIADTVSLLVAGGAAGAPDAAAGEVSAGAGEAAAAETPSAIIRSIPRSLKDACGDAFKNNSELSSISGPDRELAAQMYERLAPMTGGKYPEITRLYNLERAKFLRGQVSHIAGDVNSFAAETGLPLK